MTILVDTNVILDILLKRELYADEARIIFTMCANREVTGYLAAHSIPNLFYILRKKYSQKERRIFLRNLCDVFYISDLNIDKILSAIDNETFEDFEDCLQEECAVEAEADYIVTRNPKDFQKSRVKVIGPSELIKRMST